MHGITPQTTDQTTLSNFPRKGIPACTGGTQCLSYRLQSGDIDKHKDIITQVVAEAYAAGGQE